MDELQDKLDRLTRKLATIQKESAERAIRWEKLEDDVRDQITEVKERLKDMLEVTPKYLVELTYFRQSGKYYTEGSYETTIQDIDAIRSDAIHRVELNQSPGLASGIATGLVVLMRVRNHPQDVPALIKL